MNAKQWKHAGYRVQFRGGYVYLYIEAGNTKGWAAWRTPVHDADARGMREDREGVLLLIAPRQSL